MFDLNSTDEPTSSPEVRVLPDFLGSILTTNPIPIQPMASAYIVKEVKKAPEPLLSQPHQQPPPQPHSLTRNLGVGSEGARSARGMRAEKERVIQKIAI